MKDKFTSIIMCLVSMGIVAVIGVFILIFIQEFNNIDVTQLASTDSIEVSDNNITNPEKIVEQEEKTVDKNIEAPQILENPINSLQSASSSNEEVKYDVNIDRYLYNQLEEYSKIIYRAFETNKEQMKTGVAEIQLGNYFSDLLNQANGQELLGDYYQSAIEAYTYDNPDVFYLSPNKMYLNIETTTKANKKTYRVFINNGNQNNYLIDEFSNVQQVNTALSRIDQVKNYIVSKKTGNTYQDIKMVHDYLIDNISYDTTLAKDNIYNIYGALVNKECVCEGYARAFKYILDDLDIPCVLVLGKGINSEGLTENHAWNYVQLENTWYAVDTTWDDPIIIGGGTASENMKLKYFLKGNNQMSKDHAANGQFTDNGKIFTYPTISNNDYNV